jgi:hypothetical protein
VTDYFISNGVSLPETADMDGPLGLYLDRFVARGGDEQSRAVAILIKFKINIIRVSLYADNFTAALSVSNPNGNEPLVTSWDHVIGLDDDHGRPINNINIELDAVGAPRFLVTDKLVPVMPTEMEVTLSSRVPNKQAPNATIPNITPKTFTVPLSEPDGQPNDFRETKYRLSRPIGDAGPFLGKGGAQTVATVAPAGSDAVRAFRGALGRDWADRGQAELRGNSNQHTEQPDVGRLLQAGGLEVLEVEGVEKSPTSRTLKTKCLIRSPADVFYYSGVGIGEDGCLVTGKGLECAAPKDLLEYWRSPGVNPQVLILAASSVLLVVVSNKQVVDGAGREWAKLVRDKGCPLIAILGYSDEAPSDFVGKEIAKRMGEKIAGGLKPDDWVKTWLEVHAAYPERNTVNAVGINASAYWWIEKELEWRSEYTVHQATF